MDSRVQKFRQARLLKRKCRLVFLFAFLILALGVCAADYSVNTLVKNEKRIGVVSIDRYNESCYKASFLNMNIYINTARLDSGLKSIKAKISKTVDELGIYQSLQKTLTSIRR